MAKQTRHTYEVHLKADTADELGIDSPVETEQIDYYDSGLWVTHQDGRDFYPYHHVLTIHERPASQETASAEEVASESTEAAEEAED